MSNRSTNRLKTTLPTAIAVMLALAWAAREVAHARETSAAAAVSKTVALEEVKMQVANFEGKRSGEAGIYVQGDTPASTNFVTGRFVIDPGKTPHLPHTHVEEEVMIIESGTGEIFCDGKTTKVGPGSVMFTTPNASHGIENTGKTPLVFYFVKWAPKSSR